MTENDLFRYKSAKIAYRIALDDLREFCPAFYAANISHLTGLPRGSPPYSPDRLSGKIEEKNRYIDAWAQAAYEREAARELIGVAISALTEDSHKSYVYYRYIVGLKVEEISHKTRRSMTSLRRDRSAVLEAVKDL